MKTPPRQIRHRRVRAHLSGTTERPRMVVFRGGKSLTAQLVDDIAHQTILTVQTAPANQDQATRLGTDIAKQAKAKKIAQVVFDRAGYRYHGITKAVAEAARKEGLQV